MRESKKIEKFVDKIQEKIKQMQQHYGDPQYELDEEECKAMENAEENDEVMREMEDDDRRAEDAL